MLSIESLLTDEGILVKSFQHGGVTEHIVTQLDYIRSKEECLEYAGCGGAFYIPAHILTGWLGEDGAAPEALRHPRLILAPDSREDFGQALKSAVQSGSISSVFYIPNCDDFGALYQRIRRAIDQAHTRLEELVTRDYNSLVDLVARGISFSDIERYANKLLKNPIIILDHSYKVLAWTQRDDFYDPIWNNTIDNEVAPADDVEATDVNDFWNRLQHSPIPLFVDDVAFSGLPRRVVALIKIGSVKKGYIAMLEKDKRITVTDLITLQMLADVLSVKFSEADSIVRATGQLRDAFCSDLLHGTMKRAVDIRNRARILGLTVGPWSIVLCMRPIAPRTYIGTQLEALRDAIKNTGGSSVYTFDGRQAFFIVSFSRKKQAESFLGSGLSSIMEGFDSICSASLPTSDITALNVCHDQVLRIDSILSGLVPQSIRVRLYSELAPICLVAEAFADGGRAKYTSRAFERLREADLREGSEYIRTLRCFFSCNQNVSSTAQMMFLHRNTINYRLGRIRDMLDDDFDDYRIRLHLQLSIIAWDIADES